MMYRLWFLRISVLLVVTIMIGRLYQLQIVERDANGRGNEIAASTFRFLTIEPRRGEIYAADGTTILAESVPIYNLVVTPGGLPSAISAPEARAELLGQISAVSGLSATLVVSPSSALLNQNDLRNALRAVAAPDWQIPSALSASEPLTIEVIPSQSLVALAQSRVYSDVLTFMDPVEEILRRSNARRYEMVIIREDIPRDLALAIRENGNYLPGVEIVEAYRRRYPQSAAVPSVSHLLGYTGRISECELATENPAASWLDGMIDVVSYAPICRQIVPKFYERNPIGLPPYSSDDRIGKDGLEASYERELRGEIGVSSLLVDALQRPVSSPQVLSDVRDGNSLVLTIDLAFQREVETILQQWIAEGERRRVNSPDAHKRNYDPITNGVAVAIDPRSGRVLAMVSIPNYDNNIWVDLSRSEELQNLLAPPDPAALAELARLAPLTNRAVSGQYPPGSTLKQFVGGIALQRGVIAPDATLADPGILRLIERSGAEFELPNSVRNRNNGDITVADALRLSSNVFFASIAGGNQDAINLRPDDPRVAGLGIDALAEGLGWFGFGRPTGIDLVAEAAGLLPSRTWKAQALREAWTTGDTYNTAIGQGYLEVTPLQLVVAAQAFANGGTIYEPQIVERVIDGAGETVRPFAPQIQQRVPIDAVYAEVIRQGMRSSVVNGLNIAARNECSGLSIAGKTGTAEFGPLLLTSDDRLVRQSHSWFVGFAPYENPEIVVAVLVEGTGDLNDGSSTITVPAVTQIMQAYFGVSTPSERPSICPVLPNEAPETVAIP